MSHTTSRYMMVECMQHGQPYRVTVGCSTWRVQVLEQWVKTGQWWQDESRRLFYRLLTESGRVLEVWHEATTGAWGMVRWFD